jgi:acyl-coenzyme A thioesterase PaaI-like protein
VSSALFRQLGKNRFEPTEHARGPWDPNLLHGGPVAALLAHELYAQSGSDADWFPSRLTVDFMRPLPLATFEVTTTQLRAGRKGRLLSADCHSGDALVARASLQLVASRDVPLPRDSPARRWESDASSPEATPLMVPTTLVGDIAFHVSSVEHRSRDSALSGSGPAADWIRVIVDLLDDVPLSPLERVACAADFSNGISSSLPFDEYTFVNADLSVHLFRLPVDEWVEIDAVTLAGDDGVGMADAVLRDRSGRIGRACQSLVLAAR